MNEIPSSGIIISGIDESQQIEKYINKMYPAVYVADEDRTKKINEAKEIFKKALESEKDESNRKILSGIIENLEKAEEREKEENTHYGQFQIYNLYKKPNAADNPKGSFFGLDDFQIKGLKDAHILIFNPKNQKKPSASKDTIFEKALLVLFPSVSAADINEIIGCDIDKIFPNALVIGFNCANDKLDETVFNLISRFIFQSKDKDKDIDVYSSDIQYFLYSDTLSKLSDLNNGSVFFMHHKDLAEGDILKTAQTDYYQDMSLCIKDVVSKWEKRKIPYSTKSHTIIQNKAQIEAIKELIDTNAKKYGRFYNNALFSQVGAISKNCILWSFKNKAHYSIVDTFEEMLKSNSALLFARNMIAVDCSGFALPLLYESISELRKSGNYSEILDYLDPDDNGWGVKSHDARAIKDKCSLVVRSIWSVRPGDIMRTVENGDGAGFHIRLVTDVEQESADKITIRTAEATSMYNGIAERSYVIEYREGKTNVKCIVGDKESKDSSNYKILKSKITSISCSDKDEEGKTLKYSWNKATYLGNNLFIEKSTGKKEDLNLVALKEDSDGFDHIVEPLIESYPFRSYYFRRSKLLNLLFNNVFDANYVPQISEDANNAQSFSWDKFQKSAEEMLKFYSHIIELSNLYNKILETDIAKSSTFTKFALGFQKNTKKIEDFKLITTQTPKEIEAVHPQLLDLIYDNTDKTIPKMMALIHKDIFCSTYDKYYIEEAYKLLNLYHTIDRIERINTEIKIEYNRILSIVIKDKVYESKNGFIKYQNNEEETAISKKVQFESLMKDYLYLSDEDIEGLLNHIKDLLGRTTEFSLYERVNQYSYLINNLTKYYDKIISIKEEIKYKSGLFSILAFGFDFTSIIEYEKELFKNATKDGDNIKLALTIAVSLATGIFGPGAVLAQMGIDAVISLAFDILDEMGKDKEYRNWGQVGVNLIITVCFSYAGNSVGKLIGAAAFSKMLTSSLSKFKSLFKPFNGLDDIMKLAKNSANKNFDDFVKQWLSYKGNIDDLFNVFIKNLDQLRNSPLYKKFCEDYVKAVKEELEKVVEKNSSNLELQQLLNTKKQLEFAINKNHEALRDSFEKGIKKMQDQLDANESYCKQLALEEQLTKVQNFGELPLAKQQEFLSEMMENASKNIDELTKIGSNEIKVVPGESIINESFSKIKTKIKNEFDIDMLDFNSLSELKATDPAKYQKFIETVKQEFDALPETFNNIEKNYLKSYNSTAKVLNYIDKFNTVASVFIYNFVVSDLIKLPNGDTFSIPEDCTIATYLDDCYESFKNSIDTEIKADDMNSLIDIIHKSAPVAYYKGDKIENGISIIDYNDAMIDLDLFKKYYGTDALGNHMKTVTAVMLAETMIKDKVSYSDGKDKKVVESSKIFTDNYMSKSNEFKNDLRDLLYQKGVRAGATQTSYLFSNISKEEQPYDYPGFAKNLYQSGYFTYQDCIKLMP